MMYRHWSIQKLCNSMGRGVCLNVYEYPDLFADYSFAYGEHDFYGYTLKQAMHEYRAQKGLERKKIELPECYKN